MTGPVGNGEDGGSNRVQSGGGLPAKPFIVGIGGTLSENSATEKVLRAALDVVEAQGGRVQLFGGAFLAGLPHYDPKAGGNQKQTQLTQAVEQADGIILATPSYHGALSGLLKNALDTLQLLCDNERPYFDSRAVGCIVTSAGRQASGTTLTSLRVIIHAMRGWPTPFAAALDGSRAIFDAEGAFCSSADAHQISVVANQVCAFARRSLVIHPEYKPEVECEEI